MTGQWAGYSVLDLFTSRCTYEVLVKEKGVIIYSRPTIFHLRIQYILSQVLIHKPDL
jgi:hypothetical protein